MSSSAQQQHVAHQSHQQRLAARAQQRKVRKPKRPRAAVVATAASAAPVARSEPEFLEGLVIEGDLYLLDPATQAVYSSERDDDENLVSVGTWADGKLTPLPAAPAPAAPAPSAAPAAAPASVPHPVPQPLVFEATEEDHCETPPEAYAHIAPLLRLVARALGREPAELRVYDPYFCNGAVARHLAALGFPLVHNRNEDFYALLEAGRLPAHDVVVTNPPYSGDHPRRLLRWLARPGGAPWLALMPNWVYAKPYYAAELGAAQLFVVPRKRYPYWTPRGRRADVASGGEKAKTHGHTNAALGVRTSPFVSFWYCGGFPPTARLHKLAKRPPPDGTTLCWSLDALPAGVLADGDPRKRAARDEHRRKRPRDDAGGRGGKGKR